MEIVILHFQNAYKYPPLQNILFVLNKKSISFKCLTTGRDLENSLSSSMLYYKYQHLVFNFKSFLFLVVNKPKKILYFETYSAFSVFLYIMLFSSFRSFEILIHYHEYETLDDRNSVSSYYRFLSFLESKFILKKASWISHTNTNRLAFFMLDFPFLNKNKSFVMQNLPPEQWYNERTDFSAQEISCVRNMIYVGSLGMQSNLIQEFVEFVNSEDLNIQLDIFSDNIDEKAVEFLNEIDWISINPAVDYTTLPIILKRYDCGLILYSGVSKNHIFSIPNKFFEYAKIGLSILCTNRLVTLNNFLMENTILVSNLTKDFSFIPAFDCEYLSAEREVEPLINRLNS